MSGNDEFIRSLILDALENRSNPIILRLPKEPLIKELLQNYPDYYTLVSSYYIQNGYLEKIIAQRLEGDERSPVEIADELGLKHAIITKHEVLAILKDYVKTKREEGLDIVGLENKVLIKDLMKLTFGHFGPVTLLRMFYQVLEEES